MAFVRLIILIVLAVWVSAPLRAQTATLLADTALISGDMTITAEGNVEVLFGDSRLRASRIIYDSVAEVLTIEGPITLTEGDSTVILASSAELDADLRNGILSSARLVLDQQLQLAASEISRVDGRYTQLYKSVASSCQVCGKNGVALWQIRAKKVIHDQEERQLYFENATFLVANVPVFYLPRLRMPDPTLKRATGLLMPVYRASNVVGTGFKLPYFIVLGEHSDLTLSPYLADKTRTLEARYRKVFRSGKLTFNAAVTKDTLKASQPRGYLFGVGDFRLPRNFRLKFDIELTSDPEYLRDYGYFGRSRLENSIQINRTRGDEYISASIRKFKPLRGDELKVEDQMPNLQGELLYEKRFFPAAIGGQGIYSVSLQGYERKSNKDHLGRDGTRISGFANWSRNTMFGPGILARFGGALTADYYHITQDSSYPEDQYFLSPALEAEFRWPLIKTTAQGVSMALEPMVHLAWSDAVGKNVPNEDSTLVEFDQGNLLQISRFPGEDRYERGARATAGIQWSRYDPNGWSLDVAVGRVFRDKDFGDFTRSSGLDGTASNWLAVSRLKLADNLAILARTQIDDDFKATKTETRLTWSSDSLALASSYTWMIPDAAENRPKMTTQLALDGSLEFARNWKTVIDWRYDFSSTRSTRTIAGLQYQNECISIDLSLSRRFRSSTSVKPDIDFGFSVSLLGFGTGGRGRAHSCGG